MGRPESDKPSASPAAPVSAPARRRAKRVLLSALAGGGLTAGLGGPLAANALALEAEPASTGSQNTSTSAGTTSSAQETQPAPSTGTTGTSTSSSAAPSTTTSTSTTGTTPSEAPTATTPSQPATNAEVPTVVLQKKQKPSSPKAANPNQSSTAKSNSSSKKKRTAANNVAESPQIVADEAALEAILDSSNASDEALEFYRIPLFLLPVYKAAAVQYGVPWQVLAAINEVETDYGSDLSVSSAGAVGWMQFMPETWLQYGVDALNAGYADPYNPVDAVFAAARYLRAAGAASNLKAAIYAYNHSEEYVASVLLRAKLIATYPATVIATLTGLIDGRLPVTGRELSWSVPGEAASEASSGAASAAAGSSSASSATANATSVSPASAGASEPSTAVSPQAAAASAEAGTAAQAVSEPLQLADLTTGAEASVVAVQDGRVIAIGHSAKLGTYLKLRDVYGDVFTYAGLGSIARTYTLARTPAAAAQKPLIEAASTSAPTPKGPASAGTQRPVTLQVAAPKATAAAHSGQVTIAPAGDEGVPAGMDRVRLYAHPDNPDAHAASVARAAERASSESSTQRQPLRVGSVVAAGTLLGRVLVSSNGESGHLRFAVQPAGDSASVDPGPVLANWAELQAALHPRGAKATNPLLGATASDVLLLSQSELERAVLSDPEIQIYRCGRQDIAAGLIDRRVLAVIAFLARSGLEPTVSGLRCEQTQYTASGAFTPAYEGDSVTISAINGVAVAHHQGPGTITDLAIRTLLTLPRQFAPNEILSLMRYPEEPSTRASAAYWNQLALVFAPAATTKPAATSAAVGSTRRRSSPSAVAHPLSVAQWDQLMTRVGTLTLPSISTKPSSAAIPDPKTR